MHAEMKLAVVHRSAHLVKAPSIHAYAAEEKEFLALVALGSAAADASLRPRDRFLFGNTVRLVSLPMCPSAVL